jgi:hypothetical protein
MENVGGHVDLSMLTNITNMIRISHKIWHIIILFIFNDVVSMKMKK